MADVSEYVLKYHLTGLAQALGLPDDTHIAVFLHPHKGWTDAGFDRLVDELGSSVKQLNGVRSQTVSYTDWQGLDAEVCVFGPHD